MYLCVCVCVCMNRYYLVCNVLSSSPLLSPLNPIVEKKLDP